jgi:phage shock protein C
VPGQLTRSTDRWIGGVCGGFAEHFGWSIGGTRLGYVILSVLSTGFPGVLLYLVLWAVMPASEPAGAFRTERSRRYRSAGVAARGGQGPATSADRAADA